MQSLYISCNAKASVDHNHNNFAKKMISISGIVTSENMIARITIAYSL